MPAQNTRPVPAINPHDAYARSIFREIPQPRASLRGYLPESARRILAPDLDFCLIEQRLATLEQEVAEMKKHLIPTGRRVNWVDEFAGSMKEIPEFSEVVRLGRELRTA